MDASISSLNKDLKFVFVIGPTASGKSQWALSQAEKYNGSIVNIDSVQFYRGLEVGSAAPSLKEKKQIPHYLYSYILAPEEMTAGQYLRDFYQLLATTRLKSPVFIVGGTGFYIQALEKGMYDLEPADLGQRQKIEDELKHSGAEILFKELSFADPTHKIHINDHYRLVRAVEILRHNKKTPAQMKEKSNVNKNTFLYPYLKVGFLNHKEVALQNVKARALEMIETGIIAETENFLQQGFALWSPLSSVGYKDVTDYLLHNKSKGELLKNMVSSTMHLIKKQKTWFKRDSTILWSDFSADSLSQVEEKLDLFLSPIDHLANTKR